MKNSKSKMSCKRGFTLIELLIVVLIIGILAAVAVPQYQKAVVKSRSVQLQTLMESVAKASEMYYLQHGEYPTSFSQLDVDIALPVTGGGSAQCATNWVNRSTLQGDDFEIGLYDGGVSKKYRIMASFTTGRYQCTGFAYILDANSGDEVTNQIYNHNTFCAENYYKRSCGTNCDWGAFCQKVMGKEYVGYLNTVRFYK